MRKLTVLGAMLMLSWLGTADAALITSAADPSLAGGTVIDFETAPQGEFQNLTIGNVTFDTTGAGDNYGFISTDYAGLYNNTGLSLQNNTFGYGRNDGFREIDFIFGSAVTAFGFNWGASDVSWELRAYGPGMAFLESHMIGPTFDSNAGDFFGIANAAGISRVFLVGAPGDYIFIDNFTYAPGDSQPVPEPGTMLLLGSGLAGLAGYGRRKMKR